jgi:chromatin-remodeling ATPase INO80
MIPICSGHSSSYPDILTPPVFVASDSDAGDLPRLDRIRETLQITSYLVRPETKVYLPKVLAPSADITCSKISFQHHQQNLKFDHNLRLLLYGISPIAQENEESVARLKGVCAQLPPTGLICSSPLDQVYFPMMKVPHARKLIFDCGKMSRLDSLLHQLKAEGHRCLVYFQMTKMIDLFEEYLSFRNYKYLRLDGSTSISDRRDMVSDWQTRPEIFIFLLSTRAGGLGINLTAAVSLFFPFMYVSLNQMHSHSGYRNFLRLGLESKQ